MSVPAYLLVPDGRRRRGRPCSPSTATARASPGCAGSSRATRPGEDYAAAAGPTGPCGAGARPALLRRTGRLEPARPLRLRHQPGPPGDGGWSPADPEPVGPGPRPGRARGPSAGRPGPHRHGRVLLRGDGHPVPRRLRRPGVGGGGERLLLVVGRVAQGPLEHVRLPGAHGHARPDGARGHAAHWSPPVPCWSSRATRTCCSRWRPPRGVARLRQVYDSVRAPATGWSTTSSPASTSGTGRGLSVSRPLAPTVMTVADPPSRGASPTRPERPVAGPNRW